jgi:hypothetical protein
MDLFFHCRFRDLVIAVALERVVDRSDHRTVLPSQEVVADEAFAPAGQSAAVYIGFRWRWRIDVPRSMTDPAFNYVLQ